MTMTDKEKKREYNRRYYELHKDGILAMRKLSGKKNPASVDKEAHRKAAREYYYRKKAAETPEQREERLEKRRAASKLKKEADLFKG